MIKIFRKSVAFAMSYFRNELGRPNRLRPQPCCGSYHWLANDPSWSASREGVRRFSSGFRTFRKGVRGIGYCIKSRLSVTLENWPQQRLNALWQLQNGQLLSLNRTRSIVESKQYWTWYWRCEIYSTSSVCLTEQVHLGYPNKIRQRLSIVWR